MLGLFLPEILGLIYRVCDIWTFQIWALSPHTPKPEDLVHHLCWLNTLNTKRAVKAAGLSTPGFLRNIMVLDSC